jgi:hypothetical protein
MMLKNSGPTLLSTFCLCGCQESPEKGLLIRWLSNLWPLDQLGMSLNISLQIWDNPHLVSNGHLMPKKSYRTHLLGIFAIAV